MPNYVKFLKDIISKKRRLEEFEIVKLSEECSVILQKKLPQKLKDPGISLYLALLEIHFLIKFYVILVLALILCHFLFTGN